MTGNTWVSADGARAGRRRRTPGGRDAASTTVVPIDAASADRASADGTDVRRALAALARARGHQELADLKLRRGIYQLADLGVPQRDIADAAGISQAEVSRRLKRRELDPERTSPREVILQRDAGVISTQKMIDTLARMSMTSRTPRKAAAYDGAATVTGTAKQLMAALREGLLSDQEYEKVRGAVASRRAASSRR